MKDNFNNRIKSYMKQGLSYMEAYKATSRVITVPGCSEHEVGLALDITSDSYCELKQGFADTEGGKWLAEHSSEFGFVLRYPEGKEYITSIEYEPWHFRYVGREAAAVMNSETHPIAAPKASMPFPASPTIHSSAVMAGITSGSMIP